jgi:hypothetical protein
MEEKCVFFLFKIVFSNCFFNSRQQNNLFISSYRIKSNNNQPEKNIMKNHKDMN